MDSLIHAFGIDIKLITIQVINFAVLAGLLSYFLYKPILKLLNDREETIKQGIEDAKAAKDAKANAEIDRKNILVTAEKEATNRVAKAEDFAKEKTATIIAEAETEAVKKLRHAEEQAQALAETTKKQSEKAVAEMAVLAAERILEKSK